VFPNKELSCILAARKLEWEQKVDKAGGGEAHPLLRQVFALAPI